MEKDSERELGVRVSHSSCLELGARDEARAISPVLVAGLGDDTGADVVGELLPGMHDGLVVGLALVEDIEGEAAPDECELFGIRLDHAGHPVGGGLRAVDLGADQILPVCTPDLARSLSTPADLRHAVCLTDATWSEDWAHWAAIAAPGLDLSPRGPVFSLYALALQETLQGAGVLMAHGALVAQHLASGALVAPFAARVTLPRHLALWSLPEARRNPRMAQVMAALKHLA